MELSAVKKAKMLVETGLFKPEEVKIWLLSGDDGALEGNFVYFSNYLMDNIRTHLIKAYGTAGYHDIMCGLELEPKLHTLRDPKTGKFIKKETK